MTPGQPVGPGEPYDPNPSWEAWDFAQPEPAPAAAASWVGPPARRPSIVTTSTVFAFISFGLLALSSFWLFFWATLVAGSDNTAFGVENAGSRAAELLGDTSLNLVAAVLLATGASGLTSRRANGRRALTGGAVVTLIESLYWLIRVGADVAFPAVLLAALAIVTLACAWSRTASRWLGTTRF